MSKEQPKPRYRIEYIDGAEYIRRYEHHYSNSGELFYIKKDLLAFKSTDLTLNDFETDMDYMYLKNQFETLV